MKTAKPPIRQAHGPAFDSEAQTLKGAKSKRKSVRLSQSKPPARRDESQIQSGTDAKKFD
jgi:hypothetical protein